MSVMQHRGEIHLIIGPMFSGKTRDLKRRVDVKRIACNKTNTRCLLIKYKKDTRYHDTAMVTHNNLRDYEALPVDDLADVMSTAQQADFIFIDEGQFFPSKFFRLTFLRSSIHPQFYRGFQICSTTVCTGHGKGKRWS